MNEQELRESMDACRPASDDLTLPELHELAAELETDDTLQRAFQKQQAYDRGLAKQIQRVPLSTQRRARMLARLHQCREMSIEAPASHHQVGVRAKSRATRPGVPTRRLVFAAAGLITLSLLLMVALGLSWLSPWRRITPQQLALTASQDWLPDRSGWQSIGKLTGPQRSNASSRFLRVSPTRWQVLNGRLDDRMLVLELAGTPEPALMYVIRAGRRARYFPTSPPSQPQTSYEGRLFAAWQENARVYLLAVSGSTQDYRRLVKTSGHSLAYGRPADETPQPQQP